eukprot:gene14106-15596_t
MTEKPKSQAEELNNFLLLLDSYEPTTPPSVCQFYLERSGVTVCDHRIPKLVALATDRIVSEILYEAKQISSLRQQGSKRKRKSVEDQEYIDAEDLQTSLGEMRIYLKRGKARKE